MFLVKGYCGAENLDTRPGSVSPVMDKQRTCQTENVETWFPLRGGGGLAARGRAKAGSPMTQIDHDNPAGPAPLASHGADPLTGRFVPPGDAALSERALVTAALAVGRSSIEHLRESADVLVIADALRRLGIRIDRAEAAWHIHGLGVGGLLEPVDPIELGSSETGASLLLGLLAPYPFATRLTGEAGIAPGLCDAITAMGATLETSDGRLPLTLNGPVIPLPLRHEMATASELTRSALLLAGAQIAGITTVAEPVATADHAEKLLEAFGGTLLRQEDEGPGAVSSITGLTELQPRHLVLPADPSAAAFPIVAALIVPGSDLIVANVLVNPQRTGLIDTLLEMGADIQFLNQHQAGGEPVADLRVRSSRLKGIRVVAEHAAAMLDDIPALAIAAAYAQGETVIEGLAGLRRPPVDRLAATAAGLAACKVTVTEGEADLTIGGIGRVEGGGTVASRGDAAVAMSFLVMGLASQKRITLDDTSAIGASFPGFETAMAAVGARFEPVKGKSR